MTGNRIDEAPEFLDQATFFGQVQDPRLREFADYWVGARGTRRMLRRRDLDPLQFFSALPIVLLSRLVDGLPLYQLAGDEVNSSYGLTSIVGLTPVDIVDAGSVAFIRNSLAVVSRHRAVRYSRSGFQRGAGISVWAERLLFPLSEDDDTVDHTVSLVVRSDKGERLREGVQGELANTELVTYWKCAAAAEAGAK